MLRWYNYPLVARKRAKRLKNDQNKHYYETTYKRNIFSCTCSIYHAMVGAIYFRRFYYFTNIKNYNYEKSLFHKQKD